MTPFETYECYLALKQHFSSDYDYFKYNGKIKVNYDTFKSRKDRYFFEKLSRQSDAFGFLLSNFSRGTATYIRDMVGSPECKKIYSDWKCINNSLEYYFTEDIKKIARNFVSCFQCSNQHPELLKLYIRDEISLETLCILCQLSKCLNAWEKKLGDDVIFKDISILIQKYTPFIKYNKMKFKQIVKKQIDEVTTLKDSMD